MKTLIFLIIWVISLTFVFKNPLSAQGRHYLIPMDNTQVNHLKAYGVAYFALEQGILCKWLLNYKNGSFLIPESQQVAEVLAKRGVTFSLISEKIYSKIKAIIDKQNMLELVIEKAPKVAIYIPPYEDPWADAVTVVMEYAEIPYTKLYDTEILLGNLKDYDWLHLHHEDFTGQSGKYATSRGKNWYQRKIATAKKEAIIAGFNTSAEHKKAVAKAIQLAVSQDLYLFAMCMAPETLDIALATENVDIVQEIIDDTPANPNWQQYIDYSKTFCFKDFTVYTNYSIQSFSDIDFNQMNTPQRIDPKDFILSEFSAKIDPIPTLLCQSHTNRITGFAGQSTSFRSDKIKDGVTILGTSIHDSVRYLTGNYGKGTFTFYGGHEPEDPTHYIGEKNPDLDKYRNSPGYRLILNNVLFPSAKPPPKKT